MRRSMTALITAGAAVLVGGGLYVVTQGTADDPPAAAPSPVAETSAPVPSGTPSPSPSPTAMGADAVADPTVAPTPTSDGPAQPTEDRPAAAPDLAPTDVVVTYAGWNADGDVLEVGAYANVVEGDGTCTLTLTSGPATEVVTQEALPDVSTTSCGGLVVPGASLSSGPWDAVVSYGSASSAGTSPSFEVVVP